MKCTMKIVWKPKLIYFGSLRPMDQIGVKMDGFNSMIPCFTIVESSKSNELKSTHVFKIV